MSLRLKIASVRCVAAIAFAVAFGSLASSFVSAGAAQSEQSASSATGTVQDPAPTPVPVEKKKCTPAVAVNTNGETCNRRCDTPACPTLAMACVTFTTGGCSEGGTSCNPINANITNYQSTCFSTANGCPAGQTRCAFQVGGPACGSQPYSSCTE